MHLQGIGRQAPWQGGGGGKRRRGGGTGIHTTSARFSFPNHTLSNANGCQAAVAAAVVVVVEEEAEAEGVSYHEDPGPKCPVANRYRRRRRRRSGRAGRHLDGEDAGLRRNVVRRYLTYLFTYFT